MQIKSVEIKQGAKGSYKLVTLSERFQDKDRVGVFPDHPMYAEINPGGEIEDSMLYINKAGYLSLSNPTRIVKKPSTVTKTDVDLGFLNNRLKNMEHLLLRIGEKQGILTTAEKRELALSTTPEPVTFEANEEIDSPF
jgi:hypothetical protein